MPAETVRDKILDAAEARARRGGYNGFSFRDVAADVGVKSASVHYHFPTKADLATALADRYAAEAAAFMGAPSSALEAFERVAALFRKALIDEDKMCLCGLFAAEKDALPPDVAEATAAFFRTVLEALTAGYRRSGAAAEDAPSPVLVLSALEGALLIARATGDDAALIRVAQELEDAIRRGAAPA